MTRKQQTRGVGSWYCGILHPCFMGYFDVQSSGLNNGSITVTGTWYEGGEARGKHIFPWAV